MSNVKLLSGMGTKGPACIRLDVHGQRWLLDCGYGPDETSPFDPVWLDGVDAVFITHDHIDHIGGAAHAVAARLPIYATAQTAASLPSGAIIRELSETGGIEIEGIHVTTGRNGHALGGVWMHFDVGNGLFYSGDWSEESDWFVFNTPPPADTAILDCSYQLDPITQTDRLAAMDSLIDTLEGQILLPVPPSGRAGEMALHLLRRFGPDAVALDDTCRKTLRSALASDGVAQSGQKIAPLFDLRDSDQARFLICDTPNAETGAARQYVDAWRKAGRLGRDAHVIFTGHMTGTGRAICAEPGGYFQRWNVHPPLGDQLKMLERLKAKCFAPAFCTDPAAYFPAINSGLEIFMHESIKL